MNALRQLHQAAHNPGPLVLDRVSVQALIQRIGDLCGHGTCEHCHEPLCADCGANEPAGCPDRHMFEDHCVACVEYCRICQYEIQDSSC